MSGKYHRGQQPPKGARLESWKDTWRQVDTERTWNLLEGVRKIARRHETTCAAISLAWLLHRPEVSTIIIGARTVDQLHDNLKATDVKLAAQDLKELDDLSKPDWGYPYGFIERTESW